SQMGTLFFLLSSILIVSSIYGALYDLKIDRGRADYDDLMKLCKEVGEPMFIVHFGLDRENSCASTKEKGDLFSHALYDFCCPPAWCTNAKLKKTNLNGSRSTSIAMKEHGRMPPAMIKYCCWEHECVIFHGT
ncbi:hypothetical protein PMAYCL1PPCAC_30338, partial [Pristionchus mayeri]